MNVLIIEDSEPMRRTIKSSIEDLAREVLECPEVPTPLLGTPNTVRTGS